MGKCFEMSIFINCMHVLKFGQMRKEKRMFKDSLSRNATDFSPNKYLNVISVVFYNNQFLSF